MAWNFVSRLQTRYCSRCLLCLIYTAISKRFPTDSGGNKGPRSSGEHGGPQNRSGKRKDQDHAKTTDANQRAIQGGRDNVGVAPPTPGFGAGFPFTMPMVPPGMPPFQYPGFPGAPTG